MKLATWNVNSLNVRLPRLLGWLAAHQPDVIGLQETKLEDTRFPAMELEAAGYKASFCGQKTYNGVAILSRASVTAVAPVDRGMHDPDLWEGPGPRYRCRPFRTFTTLPGSKLQDSNAFSIVVR